MYVDPGESRQIKAASRALRLLPANAAVTALFDAIRPCVPAAAGLFSVIRPDATDALVSHPARLPPAIFESWLNMPPELVQATVAPVISSEPGRLWRDSEAIRGAQRERLYVLRELDQAGLGEGAGYKVLERQAPWSGVEHFMLAILMERHQAVPERAQALLALLHKPIQAAVLRLALPLLSHEPIYAQVMAEDSLGYICVSPSGQVIEANRRARGLVDRYRTEARIQGLRGVMEEFAARARQRAAHGQPWQLKGREPSSRLLVDTHRLAKETHLLPEDTILVCMRELSEPPVDEDHPELAELSAREREIVLLIVRSGGSPKDLAPTLGISPETVRKHTENIYRKLKVRSREALLRLLKP